MGFSGSYSTDDVEFLLTPMTLAPTDIAEKERLIQSGARHYSEMISLESPPTQRYLDLFERAFAANRQRFARDIVRLALAIADGTSDEIVLSSLARAGTPIGVLLKRALARLGRPVAHYSISIIRDRGIDTAALNHLLDRHPGSAPLFIDGWTGKGAIATELASSLASFRDRHGRAVEPRLAVVADLAGVADLATSGDDYLIPTSILNAVVSGLVSRTILNDEVRRLGPYHGCVVYDHLEPFDRSRWVVDELTADMERVLSVEQLKVPHWDEQVRRQLRETSEHFVVSSMQRYGTGDRNRIKPGIGESTRALLRRVPDRLIVRNAEASDVEHLLLLAAERGVDVDIDPSLPYRAAVVIKTLGEG